MKPSKKIMKEIIKKLFYGYMSKIKIKVIEESDFEGYYDVSFFGKFCCFNLVAKDDRIEVNIFDVDNTRYYIGNYDGVVFDIFSELILWQWLFLFTVFS